MQGTLYNRNNSKRELNSLKQQALTNGGSENRPFYSCGSMTRPMNGSEAAGDLVLIQT